MGASQLVLGRLAIGLLLCKLGGDQKGFAALLLGDDYDPYRLVDHIASIAEVLCRHSNDIAALQETLERAARTLAAEDSPKPLICPSRRP